jgi:uncharacterized phage infection (PIP) family protein YhgE
MIIIKESGQARVEAERQVYEKPKDQSIDPRVWTANLPTNLRTPVRPEKPEPKTSEELLASIEQTESELTEALTRWQNEQGRNPNQERILELTAAISQLQLKLRSLEAELEELQSQPTPTDAVIGAVARLTQRTQNLARESQYSKLHEMSLDRFDTDYNDLDRDGQQKLQRTNTISSIKGFVRPMVRSFL